MSEAEAIQQEIDFLSVKLAINHAKLIELRDCKRCRTPLKPSVAIEQTFTGYPDFPGREVVTLSPGGPGRVVECLKCPKCGWSVTK